MYKISKLPFFPRFVKKVVINAAGQRSQEVSIYSAREFCHSDVIYFAHALDIANAHWRAFLHRKVRWLITSYAPATATY